MLSASSCCMVAEVDPRCFVCLGHTCICRPVHEVTLIAGNVRFMGWRSKTARWIPEPCVDICVISSQLGPAHRRPYTAAAWLQPTHHRFLPALLPSPFFGGALPRRLSLSSFTFLLCRRQ